MKMLRYISIAVIVVLAGGWFALKYLTVDIPVGLVGVRIQEFGGGIVEEDYGPGWHRDLGPVDSWSFFDSTVQTLEMTRDPSHGAVQRRDDVRVTSSDGSQVSVDVTVKYRIEPGKAHRILANAGASDKYKDFVRNEAETACMKFFGTMSTEDFYDPEIRRDKAERVGEELAKVLEDNFVEIIDVLIRDVVFDPEYEEKIRKKKLADQEVEVNKSLGKAAEKAGHTQVIEAETVRKVRVIDEEQKAEIVSMEAEANLKMAKIQAEADKYSAEKKADADLVQAQKEAAGDLLVREAEAEGEKMRNKAMAGDGGSTIVALEAARNLDLSNITISTLHVDILDLDKMATKLGATETAPAKGRR